ncbi:MAG: V-type ATP synthase subunit A, partial [Gemmatimonadetes bacterium]|nr:V-type ATP synthase subunit A [Gemmatimonadota bacterium]
MPNAPDSAPRARVVAVRESLVTIEVAHGPLVKNEVGYVVLGEHRLKAETLRVRGRTAEMQVFEDTRGVTVGTPVELTGEMLSVTLGPGLLGQVFDGLQNPLDVVAQRGGFFLPRGLDVPPLDPDKRWTFAPTVPLGATVQAGQTLGTVQERSFVHKVMVPFDLTGSAEVTWIRPGSFPVGEVVARLRTAHGEREVRMAQSWPVRRPLPERMLRQRIVERLYPSELLPSTVRIIDTFFPIARGGTACIPGPFGAGKTVLQNLIARHADVDVVVIVACGERAGEVVETITEFPATRDPRGGGTLLDRTIIVCNT